MKQAIQIIIYMACITIIGCSSPEGEWEATKRTDSIEAYEVFLENNKKSEYADSARHALHSIKINMLEEELKNNLLKYFGANISTETPSPVSIAKFEGHSFSSLLHSMELIGGGTITFKGGRGIPSEGSKIRAKLSDPAHSSETKLTVTGVANGNRGFSKIQNIDVSEGVRIETTEGGHYIYDGGGWRDWNSNSSLILH